MPLDVHSIFVPAREIDSDTAYLFAGRQEILKAAARGMARPDGCVAIVGERGAGKSSLGRILMGLISGRLQPGDIDLPIDLPLPRRRCARVVWKSDTASVEHLLYQLLDPKLKSRSSFAKQFPEIVSEHTAEYEEISATELAAEAPGGRSKPNQVRVRKLFDHIEDAVEARAEDQAEGASPQPNGLVIVIDEMDLAAGRAVGLGSLIKNSRIQFITVGIGESIQDILDDHKSAERKFSNNGFVVEPLTRLEVRQLFAKAARKARDQKAPLSFTDEFCDLVATDFSGYPAQIQGFGLEVVTQFQRRLEDGVEVVIRGQDYNDLLKLREEAVNRDVLAMNNLDNGIDASVPRWEVLKTMVALRDQENARWVTADKLRLRLPGKYLTRLQDNLKELVQNEVLIAKDNAATVVNIASPMVLCEIKRRIRLGWDPKTRLNK